MFLATLFVFYVSSPQHFQLRTQTFEDEELAVLWIRTFTRELDEARPYSTFKCIATVVPTTLEGKLKYQNLLSKE